jgi:tryptophan-rich sensory protein
MNSLDIKRKKYLPYIICITICLILELSAALFTFSSVKTWYATIVKPDFTPPNWIFGPIWTILYLMMGFAWGHINRIDISIPLKRRANTLFIIQLTLNALWSYIYFGIHKIGLAWIDITLLWVMLTLTICSFMHISKLIGYLLMPYLLWLSYANVLNGAIWYLNR